MWIALALIVVCVGVALSPVGIVARVPGYSPPPANLPKLSRAEYFDERRMLLDARQRSYQTAEQMVSGGATGALLLSITFLEKLVPAESARHTILLVLSWTSLLGTLSLSLLGQHYAAKAFDGEIKRMNASLRGRPVPDNVWVRLHYICGIVSGILFLVGIVLLATFAYLNAPFQIGH